MTDPADAVRWLGALEQAALVRDGHASPAELVESAIRRVEALDPALNAVVSRRFDAALEDSRSPRLPDGPFRGVPILLKDIGSGMAGEPMWMGNRALRDGAWRSPETAPVARRLLQAGFIVLGKSATPEFGMQPTTQPLALGPTRNPWDPQRSVGGSSGGAAAAVSSGMVPVAHANDSAGSIRMPAAWCGLVGLKPSRGRVTSVFGTSRLAVEFALTRTVRDCAAMLDVLSGPEPGELFVLPPPERAFAREVGRDPGPLRVGILDAAPGSDVAVDPACQAAVAATVRILEAQGHTCVPSALPIFDAAAIDPSFTVVRSGVQSQLAWVSGVLGRPLEEDEVEPYTRELAGSAAVPAVDLLAAEAVLTAHVRRVAQAWEDERLDVLLTPSTGMPPARLADLIPPDDAPFAIRPLFTRVWLFARPFNLTGQPAISLPLYRTDAGLPVGVQVVARLGREDVLLRLAARLEEARPWAHLRPAAPPAGHRVAA